jgi:hypothetical protein
MTAGHSYLPTIDKKCYKTSMTKPGRLSTIEVRPLGDALELYEMVGDPAEFDVVWKGLLKYRDGLERVRQSGGDPKGIEWVTTLAANFSPQRG